ncbi:MAG: hypothetical protein RLY43_741 [Bacteroidota bacterium]|jgi:SAM-dependent methyltransferase
MIASEMDNMNHNKKIVDMYDESYFAHRNLNDIKRIAAYKQDSEFISRYCDIDGIVCDIGCSTGEFLEAISWSGARYGIEVSEYAKKIASSRAINFDMNILNQKEYFDVVIFRGTIQHLPSPFEYLNLAYESLKPGGKLFLLATPNANCLVYKIFNTLPALDKRLNFYIPSDITLRDNLENIGFKVLNTEYPYLDSPYANYLSDHIKFIKSLVSRKVNYPFWKNMMNMVAEK